MASLLEDGPRNPRGEALCPRSSGIAGGAKPPQRFIAIRTPDESWSVFDCRHDQPAEDGGRNLIGLSREQAVRAAASLNALEIRLQQMGSRP